LALPAFTLASSTRWNPSPVPAPNVAERWITGRLGPENFEPNQLFVS
jgi:hypothetical protein